MDLATRRVVVLASGKGSNLQALHRHALAHHDCGFEVAAVISDKAECGALRYAKEQGLHTAVVPFDRRRERLEWDKRLTGTIESFAPDWVVLAGFMRIVGGHVVRAFEGRILNIHPSLLPSFRGLHAIRQSLDAGVRIAGCTVHIVDHDVDTGPVLGQAAVPVFVDDDENALQKRIQLCEHELLPTVLRVLCGRQESARNTTKMIVV